MESGRLVRLKWRRWQGYFMWMWGCLLVEQGRSKFFVQCRMMKTTGLECSDIAALDKTRVKFIKKDVSAKFVTSNNKFRDVIISMFANTLLFTTAT
jgi:hypothetical protein